MTKVEKVKATYSIDVHTPVLVAAHEIDPAPYNPRRIKPHMFEALKDSLRTYGLVDPIVVQKSGMVLIGGHQRLRALKEICVEDGSPVPKVPCIVLDIDDRSAKKLNFTLNKVQGEFDPRLLGEVLAEMHDEIEFDSHEIASMGFTEEEAFKFIQLVEPKTVDVETTEPDTFGRSATLSLEFSDIRLRDAVKKILVEKTQVAKKKSGEYVADLLGCRSV